MRLSGTTCRANAASPRLPPTCARPSPTESAGDHLHRVPVNDTEGGYAYPPRVRFELAEKDIESYRRAADFLNINNVDLVSLQFEYGIFGGRAGSHILALLRELRMPIVTTLHTILREPDAHQRRVLEEVAALSDRLVVMSERGAAFLRDVYVSRRTRSI